MRILQGNRAGGRQWVNHRGEFRFRGSVETVSNTVVRATRCEKAGEGSRLQR
jgi:hypothetical protein